MNGSVNVLKNVGFCLFSFGSSWSKVLETIFCTSKSGAMNYNIIA